MNIYYYHTLNLTFKSAQTIQILKDYLYLSKHNHNIFIYGTYFCENDLKEIEKMIEYESVSLIKQNHSNINRLILKLKFLIKIYKDKKNKIIITRSIKKTSEMLILKYFFANIKIIQEFHEEAFPHLIKNKKANYKEKFLSIIKKLDAIIFTNYSQVILFEKEFNYKVNKNIVLPNGVEIEKISKAQKNKDNSKIFLTYLGQFNKWKNIELIFESFSLLKLNNIYLKIAGGKNDKKSELIINNYTKKYNINPSKVIFLGFVKNNEIVEKVLDNSNILLLPLGNNYQSKYLTSPMKLFEYMATKIPVLSIDFPSINLIIKNNEIFLSDCNAKSFSKKITEILNKKNIEKNIEKMNKLAQKYSYEKRSIKFDNFIKTFYRE